MWGRDIVCLVTSRKDGIVEEKGESMKKWSCLTFLVLIGTIPKQMGYYVAPMNFPILKESVSTTKLSNTRRYALASFQRAAHAAHFFMAGCLNKGWHTTLCILEEQTSLAICMNELHSWSSARLISRMHTVLQSDAFQASCTACCMCHFFAGNHTLLHCGQPYGWIYSHHLLKHANTSKEDWC